MNRGSATDASSPQRGTKRAERRVEMQQAGLSNGDGKTSRFFSQPIKRSREDEDELSDDTPVRSAQRPRSADRPSQVVHVPAIEREDDVSHQNGNWGMEGEESLETGNDGDSLKESDSFENTQRPNMSLDTEPSKPQMHDGLPAWLFEDDDLSKLVRKKPKLESSPPPASKASVYTAPFVTVGGSTRTSRGYRVSHQSQAEDGEEVQMPARSTVSPFISHGPSSKTVSRSIAPSGEVLQRQCALLTLCSELFSFYASYRG